MIATIVNCITVFIGSLIGLAVHSRMREDIREVVYLGAGFVSLVIGLQMAFESQRVLYLVFSLFVGGILGTIWDIEGGILRFGSFLERLAFPKKVKGAGTGAGTTIAGGQATAGQATAGQAIDEEATADGVGTADQGKDKGGVPLQEGKKTFALGFLNASVLFCVGAMTIVGAVKAGAEGEYDLILMKSIMDGFMAIMFSAALGIGVMFSIITILIYQGGLTLLASWIGPMIGGLGLSEISGLGGILVMMIGINLLKLREIKTANFLPGLVIILAFTTLEPFWLPAVRSLIGF
jgi:uncharacterized protein